MWLKCQSRPLLVLLVLLVSCRQDMHDQLKVEPFEANPLFADHRSARHPVKGTVARGHLRGDVHLYQGKDEAGKQVEAFPFPVTRDVLVRGRERYDIYCSPCHSQTGNGDGMIVQRGFRKPPPLWDQKVRDTKVGHLYDVITRGLGSMPAYRIQLRARDRWAVVAYVRVLQLAHHAKLADVPAKERAELESLPLAPPRKARLK